MGIVGTLWLILIVLKAFGVIAASWFTVIVWPAILMLILFVVMLALGVTFAGFTSFRKR